MTTPQLGKGPSRCALCDRKRAVVGWCDECRGSYDRVTRQDDGTILSLVHWAAKRARRFALESRAIEKRRAKKAGKRG